MSSIVSSVGSMMEAGVKGLINLAEGYYSSDPEDEEAVPAPGAETENASTSASASSTSVEGKAEAVSSSTRSARSRSSPDSSLIRALDVPSGWIHMQSTYLDGSGPRRVRTFGLENLSEGAVEVDIGSDLDGQLLFWSTDEEPSSSSASTTSSISNTAGTPHLILNLAARATATISLVFQADPSSSPHLMPSPSPSSNGGVTPRIFPTTSRTGNLAPGSSATSDISLSSDAGSVSGDSSQSVAGSLKGSTITSGVRKLEPIHRSFSVHGSINIRATKVIAVEEDLELASPEAAIPGQTLNLPFFATVCKSYFTAGLIDPVSGLATGGQQSSGDLVVDFGSDSIVGQAYHRDILLVNRSEIELIWTTTVLNSRFRDHVWFSLRDLDSENVFGVDHSSQPVPLPALSSRHLRLELRVKAPVTDFEFDFILANANQSGNIVTCKAIGSGQAEGVDESLRLTSGTNINFGQITDGIWARKMMTLKNAGDKPLEAKFSATTGYDVVFRLAGVAGDDMDDDYAAAPPEQRTMSTKSVETPRAASETRGRDYMPLAIAPPPSDSISDQAHSISGSEEVASSDISRQLSNHLSAGSAYGRDRSRPGSRALSRVTSRTSSHRYPGSGAYDSEDEDLEPQFFGGLESLNASPQQKQRELPIAAATYSSQLQELSQEKAVLNQIEELTMRPGTEYRVFVLYRPIRDPSDTSCSAGELRTSTFKVYVDSGPTSRSQPASYPRSRKSVQCVAESCTPLISLPSGNKIDFGEVTVGASKSYPLSITNLSALSVKVEIAAISKVLNTNRNVIVIPPHETIEEKIEFFPRRINERYEKQIFVRNLFNRANDQVVDIRSKNVDVHNLTLHSHLYRILTPSGSNFLDFGSVVINSPSIRTVLFENLTASPLVLELNASQPEDVELYLKADQSVSLTTSMDKAGRYADDHDSALSRVTSPSNGELKERFMETMRELSQSSKDQQVSGSARNGTTSGPGDKGVKAKAGKAKAKPAREKSAGHGSHVDDGKSVGAVVGAALRKGGRGRPVQLYGNAVVFKDRHLLQPHEYLDLAAGPPVAAHRTSPRSKRTALLDTIEQEDKSKLSGQHPKIPKLDFAASAKATGLLSKESKVKKHRPVPPPSPSHESRLNFDEASVMATPTPASLGAIAKAIMLPDHSKSPALTAKKLDSLTEVSSAEISKMTVEDLLLAIEQHDVKRGSIIHASLEDEEAFLKRYIELKKELSNLTTSKQLISASNFTIPPNASRQLIVIMTPNGSIRPHITTRAKRADSRVFIKLVDFDRSKLYTDAHGAMSREIGLQLPVRDLIIRSNCVRSVLEVQQTSINFGTCEKGQAKSKTIVIHNKSDTVGLFRLRTSGSIASGDLKLGLGRYGVVPAFGRKEVDSFSFVPSLTGTFNEAISVLNILDSWNDQSVAVKANVRKAPTFALDTSLIDFGALQQDDVRKEGFVITNVSKHERTFVVAVQRSSITTRPAASAAAAGEPVELDTGCSSTWADLSLAQDEGDVGVALSKHEEEEVEGILQKLKIARRKGKDDKIKKYEGRLAELGVEEPKGGEPEAEAKDDDKASSVSMSDVPTEGDSDVGPASGARSPAIASADEDEAEAVAEADEVPLEGYGPHRVLYNLTVTLQPNQKTRIWVNLLPRALRTCVPATQGVLEYTQSIDSKITVHDRRNTDEMLAVEVKGVLSKSLKHKAAAEGEAGCACPVASKAESLVTSALPQSSDTLHLALMRHCLELTLLCPVSPTAFCVGSSLFLPAESTLFSILRPHFPIFHHPSSDPNADSTVAGLLLADGYSRQIPGNTHAEANALTNFRTRLLQLHSSALGTHLPATETILAESVCYATMEPCSIRTSGGPSCALELVRAGVKAVWLGVEEPPDFVQCEGVDILQKGGVVVGRVIGLEKECLEAARRGREEAT